MNADLLLHLDQARMLVRQGHDAKALESLQIILRAWAAGPKGTPTEPQIEAWELMQRSFGRLARYQDALRTASDALLSLHAPQHAVARVRMLNAMAYAYVQLALPEAALKCARAALPLALAHGESVLAAAALECVGMCHASLGDCPAGERFLLEALGLVLQSGDDEAIQMRLLNLMYLSCLLHDAYHEAGDDERARAALARCTRIAAQGDRLKAQVGEWQHWLWRANRAGWLRRRGDGAEALAEYRLVHAQAVAHGWSAVERVASFEMAVALVERGQTEEALLLLARIPTGSESAPDAYDISLRAHRLMRDVMAVRQQPELAQQHEAAYRLLHARRESQRQQAAGRLSSLTEAVVDALADADRSRLDSELGRLQAIGDTPRLFDTR